MARTRFRPLDHMDLKISQAIVREGHTMRTLAKRAAINENTAGAVLNNPEREFHTHTLTRVAKALEIEPAEFARELAELRRRLRSEAA